MNQFRTFVDALGLGSAPGAVRGLVVALEEPDAHIRGGAAVALVRIRPVVAYPMAAVPGLVDALRGERNREPVPPDQGSARDALLIKALEVWARGQPPGSERDAA